MSDLAKPPKLQGSWRGTPTLNPLAAETAVVDRHGVILAADEPWWPFALESLIESGKPAPHTGVGSNSLASLPEGAGFTSPDKLWALTRASKRRWMAGFPASGWNTPAVRRRNSVGSR